MNHIISHELGALLLVFLLYVASTRHIAGRELIGFALAMSNAYGLFVLVAMLGYALIEIPRSFWYVNRHHHCHDRIRANRELMFKYVAFHMVEREEKYDEAKIDLDEVVTTIAYLYVVAYRG